MEPSISIKDVADLLFSARERIDFYWNFYVVVVVAVIGWLMSLKQRLTRPMKALVSLVFVIAAGMNLTGLYSSYTFAEALRNDLLKIAPSSIPLTETRELLVQHSYLSGRTIACWVHVLIGATILLVVWLAALPPQIPNSRDGDTAA